MSDIPPIDIEAIRLETRRLWKEANRDQPGILGLIENTVPAWLIIIALVMLALSFSHTVAMFDKITPGLGWVAPFGVEFTLIYASFRRKRAERRGLGTPWFLWVLVGVMFFTAIIVNGAGALSAATTATGIQKLSFSAITEQFGGMEILTQVALILAILAAFIIPLGTVVAGEGLAALFFDRDVASDALDQRWSEVEFHELRKAYFAAYTKRGVKPGEAKRQASMLASGFLDRSQPLPASQTEQDSSQTPGQTKRARAKQLLAENPEWMTLPLRVLQDRTGLDKSAFEHAKKQLHSNGREHGNDD